MNFDLKNKNPYLHSDANPNSNRIKMALLCLFVIMYSKRH